VKPLAERLAEPFAIDLRTLALFRVCLGFVLIGDLLTRVRILTAHYTDYGAWPRMAAETQLREFGFSFHLLGGSAAFQAVLFAIAGLLALLLIVGYRTRVVSLLCWVMLLSLNHRNYLVLQSSDSLMLALLFWSLFLPLGARYSVDAALNPRPIGQNSICNLASAALLVQVLSVYFFGALLKTGDVWRISGDAVYQTLHFSAYASPLGVWIGEALPVEVLRGLTWYTWYIELWGPILVLLPFYYQQIRFVILPGLILLHIGFLLLLTVGIYPFVSITSLLLLLPTRFWDSLQARLRTPERMGLAIYYDAPCEFCRKTCLLLRTFLLLESTPVRPAQEHPEIGPLLEAENSWVVEDHDGRRYLRWSAMVLVLRRSWLLAPVAGLLNTAPLRALGDRFYRWVGEHRQGLGKVSAALLPYRRISLRLPLLVNLGVGGLMLVLIWSNTAILKQVDLEFHWRFKQGLKALWLDQRWMMFAPEPGRTTRWMFVAGELEGGQRVNAYANDFTPSVLEKPADGSGYFDGYRWRKYFRRRDILTHWPRLADFYCRRWNSAHPAQPLERVYGHILTERTARGVKDTDQQWQRHLDSLGARECP